MDLKRRQFLKTSFASLGAVTAGAEVATARAFVKADEAPAKQPKNPFSTDPVATVKLTDSIMTSRLGFGTGMSGYQRSAQLTRMDRKKAESLLNYAYDKGIRFFDCADLYGTHEVVSSTLKDKPRDSYVVVSKLWPHGGGIPEQERPSAEVVVKRFLKELNTDYLDVLQLHCMMKPDWRGELESYVEDLEKLKKEGLIRAHGVSCHSVGSIDTGGDDPWVDTMHVRLNTSGARMDGTFEENVNVIRKAHDNGKGTICMKVVGEGTMRERADRMSSIDRVIREDIIDVFIVGFEELWQIDELIENVEISLKGIEAERKAQA